MAIRTILPKFGTFFSYDFAEIIEFVATDSTVTAFSTTQFSGVGTYKGVAASYVADGVGFGAQQIGGITYITSGIVDSVTFTSGSEVVSGTSIDINMATFSPIIQADESGVAPLGIENFLMSKAWNITMGNGDDIAPRGTLIGDGAVLNMLANDVLKGQGGNDNLFGGDGNDLLNGGVGNDILSGGKGADIVVGGEGIDRVTGDAGNDKLLGGSGSDKLLGGKGADDLKGGGGADVLRGGRGADVLEGGKGNDTLIGDAGFDQFVFKDGDGRDKIKNFSLNNNEDIDLRAVSAITGFADLKTHHMIESNGNVVIDDGAGSTITLLGLEISDLNKGDFLF